MPLWSTPAYSPDRSLVWPASFYYLRTDAGGANLPGVVTSALTNTANYHAGLPNGELFRFEPFTTADWDFSGSTFVPQTTAGYFHDVWPGGTPTPTTWTVSYPQGSNGSSHLYFANLRQENSYKGFFSGAYTPQGNGGYDRHAVLWAENVAYGQQLVEAYGYNGTSANATQVVTYDLTDYTLPNGTSEPAGVVAARMPVAPFQFTYADLVAAGTGDLGHMIGWVGANYGFSYKWPARSTDGQLTPAGNYLVAGSVIRLKSTWTIPAGWPETLKALARTLQRYGAVLFDKNSTLIDPSGGKAVISSVSDPAWPTGGSSLRTLWAASGPDLSDFEEVDISSLKVSDDSIRISSDPDEPPSCSVTATAASPASSCGVIVDATITNPDSAVTWYLYYGDGTVTTLGGLTGNPAITGGYHAYAVSGTYTVKVEGRDASNVILTSCTDDVTVVCDAEPVECSATVTLNPSGTNPLEIEVTGSLTGSPWAAYHWTFDWGDGSPLLDNGTNPTASHTYALPGTYTINTCAVSDDVPGDFCCNTDEVTVTADEACSLTLTTPDFVTCNGAVIAGLIISPVPADPWIVIDWGDGSPDTVTNTPGPTHTYADCGTYTATATFYDGNPGEPGAVEVCVASDEIRIFLVEPVARADWPTPIPEEACWAGFTVCLDPGPGVPWSYTIEWASTPIPNETYSGTGPSFSYHDSTAFDGPGNVVGVVTFTVDGEPAGVCAVSLVIDCNPQPPPPLNLCRPEITWEEINWSGFEVPAPSPVTTTSTSFRVDYEDSLNCGGTNSNVQTANAVGTFTLTEAATLSVVMDGIGELQDTGYEELECYVQRPGDPGWVLVGTVSSAGGQRLCQMGPLVVSNVGPDSTLFAGLRFDIPVPVGTTLVRLDASTNDGRYHVDAWEGAEFYVTCPAERSAPDTNCLPGATLGNGEDLRVYLVNRGAETVIAELTPTSGYFTRALDKTSELQCEGIVTGISGDLCCDDWAEVYPWVTEIYVWRDGRDAWSGPVTEVEFSYGKVSIRASDLTAWWDRRTVPDLNFTGQDIADIFAAVHDAAMAPDPVPNFTVVPTATDIFADRNYQNANYEYASDVLDELSKTGIDWTCYGRTVLVGGEEVPASPYFVMLDDFWSEPPSVVARGNDQATKVIVKGEGVVGVAAAPAAYQTAYGLLVRVFEQNKIKDPASASAAARTRLDLLKDPYYLETPSGARLTPGAPVTLPELIPGIRVRVVTTSTCRSLSSDFRLTGVKVDFEGGVSIDLQPLGTYDEETAPRYAKMIALGDSMTFWSEEAAIAAGKGEPATNAPSARWQDLLVTDGLVGYSLNAAKPGVTTRSALATPVVPFQSCDLLVIMLGANDMVHQDRTFPPGPFIPNPASWVLPPEYKANLIALMDAYPHDRAVIVVSWKWNVNLVDSAFDNDGTAAARQSAYVSAALAAAAERNALVIDLAQTYNAPSRSGLGDAELPAYLCDALIHPSTEGHRGIANLIEGALSVVP
jgi:hypothetical protein